MDTTAGLLLVKEVEVEGVEVEVEVEVDGPVRNLASSCTDGVVLLSRLLLVRTPFLVDTVAVAEDNVTDWVLALFWWSISVVSSKAIYAPLFVCVFGKPFTVNR